MTKPKAEEGRGWIEDLRRKEVWGKSFNEMLQGLTPAGSSHQNLKYYGKFCFPIMYLLSACVHEMLRPRVLSLILICTDKHNINLLFQ